MPTEQSTTSKGSGRITPIGNTTRTLEGNQYRYHWSTIKVEQKRCYYSYHEQIHQDNQAKSNNSKHFLRRNCKNLLERNIENTWSIKEDSR